MKMNLAGTTRKALVAAIAEITGKKPVYKGMPTSAYEVCCITVERDGSIVCEDEERLSSLLQSLAEKGFTAEDKATEATEPQEPIGLTVTLPLEAAAVGNLTNLLEAKGTLIKKALGISDTPIVVTEETISFPWFTLVPNADEAKAYTQLIAALCHMVMAGLMDLINWRYRLKTISALH